MIKVGDIVYSTLNYAGGQSTGKKLLILKRSLPLCQTKWTI